MHAKLRLFQSKYVFYELLFSFIVSLSFSSHATILSRTLSRFCPGPFSVSIIAIGHLRPLCIGWPQTAAVFSVIADHRSADFRFLRSTREKKKRRGAILSLSPSPRFFSPVTINVRLTRRVSHSRFRQTCVTELNPRLLLWKIVPFLLTAIPSNSNLITTMSLRVCYEVVLFTSCFLLLLLAKPVSRV